MNRGYLSKKKFHPAKLSNQIKVWKAEQQQKEEQQLVEILKKEKFEEIQHEKELKKQCKERGEEYIKTVDWIYESPSGFIDSNKSNNLNENNQSKQSKQNETFQNETFLKEKKEQKEKEKIKISDPFKDYKPKREQQIESIMKDKKKIEEIELKCIKKLLLQFDLAKGNREKQNQIKQKLWLTSEKGKIGNEIIKQHNELSKWWIQMKQLN